MILLLTSDMRSDLLSLRPLHITEPLASIEIERLSQNDSKTGTF